MDLYTLSRRMVIADLQCAYLYAASIICAVLRQFSFSIEWVIIGIAF